MKSQVGKKKYCFSKGGRRGTAKSQEVHGGTDCLETVLESTVKNKLKRPEVPKKTRAEKETKKNNFLTGAGNHAFRTG